MLLFNLQFSQVSLVIKFAIGYYMSQNSSLDRYTPKLEDASNSQTNRNSDESFPSQIEKLIEADVQILFSDQNRLKYVAFVAKKVLDIINKYANGVELPPQTKQTFSQTIKMQTKKLKDEEYGTIVYPSRKTKWVRNISKEEQKQKYEQRKYIAFSFCQHGINYHYITQKYPKMEAKTYRCIVEAVNNETVNEIVDFLRYQCNIQIQRLNRDQKRSIRTQLTKIKDWLGNRDPQQLQTFYKFIYRHYDKQLQVKFQDALKLYKTIIQIIKSPFVNVLQAEQAAREENEGEGPIEQEKAMIILFIKHKDEIKVSDQLCQKYGYDVRWCSRSVKVKLRLFLQASFDKLIATVKEDARSLYINFLNQKRREMLQEKLDIPSKIEFYSYFLEKKTTSPKIKHLLLKLQDFFKFYEKDASEVQFPKTEQSNITDLTQAEIVKSQVMERTAEYGMDKTSEFSLEQTNDYSLIKKEELTEPQDNGEADQLKLEQ